MNFIFFIAKRYIRIKKGEFFRSLITIFSVTGVALGVATLIVVLSVMNGMSNDLREKILGTNGHIMVSKFYGEEIYNVNAVIDSIKHNIPEVVGATPYIFSKILIRHGNFTDGVIIRGVDTLTMDQVSNLRKKVILGRFDVSDNGVVLGNYLADGLRAHVGDTVEIAVPFGGIPTPFGILPRAERFVVKGIFDVGMYEFNATLALVSIEKAKGLLGRSGVTGIELSIKDIYKAPEVSRKLVLLLGYPYRVRNWIEMNRNLFAALKLEKFAMFIILALIVVVAAFNIASILIMIVLEKTREIGILRAMGATGRKIMRIFMIDGLLVGGIGTTTGLIIGYVLCWALGKYKFISLPADVYFLDKLPVKMQPLDFLIVGVSAIIISFLATIYPALRASKMDPVEAIRNE
ncbi:MAG TPA: lipoprotein-releasing ABC transporter permease subunit [candidate division WOR-3 bacterium]|uniref:Lipoprotein-releasing ABC transporter permease subunit n=1 Tax=candidate division WOR-3 bacterium TaxID=2052148 RepID=A0A7C0VDN0_UNCW3|nr:lipoprotein-releasing ABC transporter permease subunit [candidate division WOR-3 bacterium]